MSSLGSLLTGVRQRCAFSAATGKRRGRSHRSTGHDGGVFGDIGLSDSRSEPVGLPDVAIAALWRGIRDRQPEAGLIHHSDRGGQFASQRYRSMLRRAGMQQRMSTAGNCYDNAFLESCFGTIKTELQLVDSADDPAAVHELSEFIGYDNHERRHSGIGSDTPAEFERKQPTESITPTVPKSATDLSAQPEAPHCANFCCSHLPLSLRPLSPMVESPLDREM